MPPAAPECEQQGFYVIFLYIFIFMFYFLHVYYEHILDCFGVTIILYLNLHLLYLILICIQFPDTHNTYNTDLILSMH